MGQCMKERGEGKKLVGVAPAQKLLVYALLLRWYVEHRAFITAVHRTIDYQGTKLFSWFVEQISEARRPGEVDKSKPQLAEVFKLLGKTAHGKRMEAVERQAFVIFRKDEKMVDRALRAKRVLQRSGRARAGV